MLLLKILTCFCWYSVSTNLMFVALENWDCVILTHSELHCTFDDVIIVCVIIMVLLYFRLTSWHVSFVHLFLDIFIVFISGPIRHHQQYGM